MHFLIPQKRPAPTSQDGNGWPFHCVPGECPRLEFERRARFLLTATVPTGNEAASVFNALCKGGKVTLPPTETFYSVFHAAVTDKFGVNWDVVAEEAPRREEIQ